MNLNRFEVQIYTGSEQSSGATFFTNPSTACGLPTPPPSPFLKTHSFASSFQPAQFSMYKETTHTHKSAHKKKKWKKKKKSFIQYIETLASLYIQQLVLVSATCRFTCRSPKQNLFVTSLNYYYYYIFFAWDPLQKNVMRKSCQHCRCWK